MILKTTMMFPNANASSSSFSSSSQSLGSHRIPLQSNRSAASMVAVKASMAAADPYETLRISRGASQSEIKKAFRRLALEYHPDVCKVEGGDNDLNCSLRFQQINRAYDILMSNLRGETVSTDDGDEAAWREDNPEWDLWEEWMGWEGAGIRDYSSHINPYI